MGGVSRQSSWPPAPAARPSTKASVLGERPFRRLPSLIETSLPLPDQTYLGLRAYLTLRSSFATQSYPSARPGPARLGSARLGSVRFDSVRLGSARFGPVPLGLVRCPSGHSLSRAPCRIHAESRGQRPAAPAIRLSRARLCDAPSDQKPFPPSPGGADRRGGVQWPLTWQPRRRALRMRTATRARARARAMAGARAGARASAGAWARRQSVIGSFFQFQPDMCPISIGEQN